MHSSIIHTEAAAHGHDKTAHQVRSNSSMFHVLDWTLQHAWVWKKVWEN